MTSKSEHVSKDADGEVFGPYLVFERLGIGGMATVHRAKERGIEGFERMVALKRILPHLAEDEEFVVSFVKEAKLASMLQHPNIVQIFELGRVGPVYFISMEFISGFDIRKTLRQARRAAGPPPLTVVASLLSELCDSLDYAHNKRDNDGNPLGLVHRDVSPSNLLISKSGNLKIIDFGIAKATSEQQRTQTGRIKGKLAYMAPEALLGSANIDARTDIFSIGVIAHELLTARPLFASKNDFKIIQRIQSAEVAPPSQFNPKVPPELDRIVLKALAKEKKNRFSSAGEMRQALLDLVSQYHLHATNLDVIDWCEWAFGLPVPERRNPSYSGGDSHSSVSHISYPTSSKSKLMMGLSPPSKPSMMDMTPSGGMHMPGIDDVYEISDPEELEEDEDDNANVWEDASREPGEAVLLDDVPDYSDGIPARGATSADSEPITVGDHGLQSPGSQRSIDPQTFNEISPDSIRDLHDDNPLDVPLSTMPSPMQSSMQSDLEVDLADELSENLGANAMRATALENAEELRNKKPFDGGLSQRSQELIQSLSPSTPPRRVTQRTSVPPAPSAAPMNLPLVTFKGSEPTYSPPGSSRNLGGDDSGSFGGDSGDSGDSKVADLIADEVSNAPVVPDGDIVDGRSGTPQAAPSAPTMAIGVGAEPPSGQFPISQQPSGQFPVNQQPSGEFPINQQPSGQFPISQQPSGQFPTQPTGSGAPPPNRLVGANVFEMVQSAEKPKLVTSLHDGDDKEFEVSDKSGKGMLFVIIGLLVALVGGGGATAYFMFFSKPPPPPVPDIETPLVVPETNKATPLPTTKPPTTTSRPPINNSTGLSMGETAAKIKFLIEPDDAAILINGVQRRTNLLLQPGVYEIKIRREGYKSWIADLIVEPGESQTLRIALQRSGTSVSYLKITSRPPGLTAKLDGETLSKPTPTETMLEPGTHVLTLEAAGNEVWRKEFTASPDTQYSFEAQINVAGRKN